MKKPTAKFTARRLVILSLSLLTFACMVSVDSTLLYTRPVPVGSAALLRVLSDNDIGYYRQAFALHIKGEVEKAHAMLDKVNDPVLKETLGRKPIATELPSTSSKLLRKFSKADEKSQLGDNGPKAWIGGLAAFRKGDMERAADSFKEVLNSDLTTDDRAAAAFWAYRAYIAMDDTKSAMQYAQLAANEAPGFYSILARHVTGAEAAAAKSSRMEQLTPVLQKETVRRAIAFKEIGQQSLAEEELLALFPYVDDAERKHLLMISTLIGLSTEQMQVAFATAKGNGQHASYPLPQWKPIAGYRVDPALLFAIMRQESGFNPLAKSPSGALGVMQLMPATASAMSRGSSSLSRSGDPAVSMTLGQRYIEHLMNLSSIGDNLIYLTAAYNAGPGTLLSWKRKQRMHDDPLLFIESIPYSETREYVMRVIGNYWIYSERLGGYDASVTALAQGQWPRYEGSRQLAEMQSRVNSRAPEKTVE